MGANGIAGGFDYLSSKNYSYCVNNDGSGDQEDSADFDSHDR